MSGNTTKIIAVVIVLVIVAAAAVVLLRNDVSLNDGDGKESDSDHYPVTISTMDYNASYVDMTFNERPTRVITTNQMQTEMLLYFGLGEYIVGCAYLDNGVLPELLDEYNKLNVLSVKYPTLEQCVALQPDLILGWRSAFADTALGSVNTWLPRGCNSYVVDQSSTIDGVLDVIANIGKIFNIEKKTDAYIEDAKNTLAAIQTSIDASGKEKPNVLLIEIYSTGPMAYGGLSLPGSTIATAGGLNVFPDEKYPASSYESIAGLNPEKIIIMHFGNTDDTAAYDAAVKSVTEYKGWASVEAVVNGDVFPIGLADMWGGGIRIIDSIQSIHDFLYED
ncbi:MAG: ABC transporter substrate-binding protein [Candidatus Methanoplasma sp.]|jgi:iron complex transport system substrate-binding protein|nr:ABC transporter substrate-binding protein [Candidatus Methanoplasma sp.]